MNSGHSNLHFDLRVFQEMSGLATVLRSLTLTLALSQRERERDHPVTFRKQPSAFGSATRSNAAKSVSIFNSTSSRPLSLWERVRGEGPRISMNRPIRAFHSLNPNPNLNLNLNLNLNPLRPTNLTTS